MKHVAVYYSPSCAFSVGTIGFLLLRGADSDLLTKETALAMTGRGPKAYLHEFPGVGHAPMLVVPEQVAVVREFLRSP